MKIAIAGATGILGRWLVPLLAQQGHAVAALTPSPEKAQRFFGASASVAECDLLDAAIASRLPALLEDCDAVAHIATALPPDLSVPGAFDKTNRLRIEGTERLLAASGAAGVRLYVQQSTVFGYPDKGEEWIGEEVPLETGDGILLGMERLVRKSALDWCILRAGRFVGKDTYQEQTVERLRAGRASVPCDGRNFVPLVHVADVAVAFAAAFVRAPSDSVLNIVAESVRNGEYLDQLAARAGSPAPRRDPQAQCPASQRCTSAAARSVLAWAPAQSIYAFDV
jgi:nucleoside-diphosphate-sugar epimerase